MANVELLKEKISNSGMTVTAIADKSGILRETLYNRMKSGNFYASEITLMCEYNSRKTYNRNLSKVVGALDCTVDELLE